MTGMYTHLIHGVSYGIWCNMANLWSNWWSMIYIYIICVIMISIINRLYWPNPTSFAWWFHDGDLPTYVYFQACLGKTRIYRIFFSSGLKQPTRENNMVRKERSLVLLGSFHKSIARMCSPMVFPKHITCCSVDQKSRANKINKFTSQRKQHSSEMCSCGTCLGEMPNLHTTPLHTTQL